MSLYAISNLFWGALLGALAYVLFEFVPSYAKRPEHTSFSRICAGPLVPLSISLVISELGQALSVGVEYQIALISTLVAVSYLAMAVCTEKSLRNLFSGAAAVAVALPGLYLLMVLGSAFLWLTRRNHGDGRRLSRSKPVRLWAWDLMLFT